MMKTILLVVLFSLCSSAIASEKLGIGVMIGAPTGLNGKYWLSQKNAIDGGAAFNLGKHNHFNLHSDYLFHKFGELIFEDKHQLDVYYGIGGRMKFSDDIQLGVRLPLGIAHMLENESADIFGEIAPIVDFVGRTGLDLHLAIGGRYYF